MSSRDEVKAWLKRINRDRRWLADEAGVSKNTVNNWFSGSTPMPTKARRIIELLMGSISTGTRLTEQPRVSLVLEIEPANFDSYNQAASAKHMGVREWASTVLDQASASQRLRPNAFESRDRKVVSLPTSVAQKRHSHYSIICRGGVAAGTQMACIDQSEIPASKKYPKDHYALLVSGQSMEPDIPDNSHIVVRPWKHSDPIKENSIVVYSDSSGSSLKHFHFRSATPDDNPDFVDSAGKIAVLRSVNPGYPDVRAIEGGKIDAVFVELLA